MRSVRLLIVLAMTLGFSAVALSGTAGAATTFTCTSGPITGSYVNVTIAGNCTVPAAGTLTVTNKLTIGPNATLNAITEGSTVTVTNGILVKLGGSLGLGCSPETGCTGTTADVVNGGITAYAPKEINLHFNTITGGVTMTNGGTAVSCNIPSVLAPFAPQYSDLEDNTITGDVRIDGYHSCWLGFIRNSVLGSVTIQSNLLADPDANEVVSNQISNDLTCVFNGPHAQIGDSTGALNLVGGTARWECKLLAGLPIPPIG